MEWSQIQRPSLGTRMLMPMAWSLLPLVGGLLLLFTKGGLMATGMLAAGVMLSLIAVWLGSTYVPGRVDMLVLLLSPMLSFILFFQPPEIAQAVIALIPWWVNYSTAARLSALSTTGYRIEWDPKIPLPEIEGATYLSRRWAARPLMRIDGNMVIGIRVDGVCMIEADEPITFTFSEE